MSLEHLLPTLDRQGVTLPDSLDATQTARDWFDNFTSSITTGKWIQALSLLTDDAYFRDLLALTWDIRTLHGTAALKPFFETQLPTIKFNHNSFKLVNAQLDKPFPDLAWITGSFTFDTDVSTNSGIFRLVPTAGTSGNKDDIVWKACTIFTNMEDLKDFPEQIGHLRNHLPNHGKWAQQREKEVSFVDEDPTVLVIGGNQSGLIIGARLKTLGVKTLIVDRFPRIGDQWRTRYEALCLHDPVWYDHLPYIPFPPTWPVFTPAIKHADWLESYAHSLELNVWTSSEVTKATQEPDKRWKVTVKRADGSERQFTIKHIIFATGVGSGTAKLPDYPGMDNYEGTLIHSTKFGKAKDHVGKKVVVIGSSTSAHDISSDLYYNGIDVTMIQRGPTYVISTTKGIPLLMQGVYWGGPLPTEVADRVSASLLELFSRPLRQRGTKLIAEADKEILDGLAKVGFKLSMGIDGTGVGPMVLTRLGGYYLDVGGSQLIIDGKIKLKNDSQIERFTKNGIRFENGSELDADVIVFATGYGDNKSALRDICGDAVADQCKPVWDLDKEGELNSIWRDTGVPNLWYMMGNLAMARFYSKHLALQIKAIEEGVFTKRYGS